MPERAAIHRATPPRRKVETRPDATQRGYDRNWKKRRAAHLAQYPLCVHCQEQGRVTEATVADHVTPHRGDVSAFLGEIQSLCKRCHDIKTAKGG